VKAQLSIIDRIGFFTDRLWKPLQFFVAITSVAAGILVFSKSYLDRYLAEVSLSRNQISELAERLGALEADNSRLRKESTEFQTQLFEIQKSLYSTSDAVVPAPGNKCPAGTYAVNLGQISVPGGAHGFLESVSIQCKAIVLDRPKN
jgi:hypothetical protein